MLHCCCNTAVKCFTLLENVMEKTIKKKNGHLFCRHGNVIVVNSNRVLRVSPVRHCGAVTKTTCTTRLDRMKRIGHETRPLAVESVVP